MAKFLNRSELSEAMGVNLTTIDVWIKAGMPAETKGSSGRPWSFDLPKCVRWYGEYKSRTVTHQNSDAEELKLRKLAADAQMMELDLEIKKGTVGLIEDFEKALSATMLIARLNLQNVPSRAYTRLVGVTDEVRFKAILSEEITEALTRAVESPINLDEEDGEEESEG